MNLLKLQKKLLLLVIFFQHSLIWTQQITRKEYIDTYSNSAIEQMKKYNIPASITLAQGIIESNNGNSRLATKAKNHFGIKCHGWEGKKIYADDDAKNECFRSYKNVAHSFEDHSLFLTKYKRYKFLFEYKITDYKAWSKGLKKAGYATSSKYADLLVKIIEENELNKYDNPKKIKAVRRPFSQTTRKVYLHPNKIKYTIVGQEESLLSISQELDIRLWQLYRYNEIDKNYELKKGEKIFIQPKRNKSKTSIHKVIAGETIRLISQKYGVKIKKLKKRNSDLITFPIKAGDIIKLR